jgi:hypothetical protein
MAGKQVKTFANQRVVLDGLTPYSNCTFENCTIVYDGAKVALDGCILRNCELILEGAAAATIATLVEMTDHDPEMVEPIIQKLNGSIVEADDHD